jgi:putative ABC transport system permease protein
MRGVSGVTNLVEGVFIALEAIRANKARAALTILGVAIGVFAVVIMSAAIHGINEGVAKEIESAGPTTFFVQRFPIAFGPCTDDPGSCTWRNNPPVRYEEALALGRLPTVKAVSVSTNLQLPVKYRDRSLSSVNFRANTPNWLDTRGADITQGRSFTQPENAASARVVVINTTMATRLFGDGDPIGKTIMIGSAPLDVIGVYSEGAAAAIEGERPRGVVPYETARHYLGAPEWWLEVVIKPEPTIPQDQAIDDVTAFMRGSRGLRPGTENNFAIVTQDKLFETFQKVTGAFFLVMIALSGIGLMVGGVGVVAIMMISVTERTKEIGVRKALGATRRVILWQFLVEAATLTLIGAMFGLSFGWLVSYGIRSATPVQASIPPGAIVFALAASAITGILFGMYPAARAANLDPIAALRHE